AATAALTKLYSDPDARVVAAACHAATRFADATFAVEPLLTLATSQEPIVRLASTHALSRLIARPTGIEAAARRRIREQFKALTRSKDPDLRLIAARGLVVPGGEDEAAPLGALVSDPDPRVRIQAVSSLSFPGAPVEPFLKKALADKDDRVMLAVVDGLGRLQLSEAVDELVHLVVFDPRPWLRERAVASLGKANPEYATKLANGLCKDELAGVRAACARNLWEASAAEPLAIVKRLSADSDPAVQAAAIPALAAAPGKLAELLGPALSAKDVRVRAAVARAAGRRLARPDLAVEDRDDALAVLERVWAASSQDDGTLAQLEIVRAAASTGADPKVHTLLDRALQAPARRVRIAAIDAERKLFSEDRSASAGAPAERTLEDYVQILRWAEQPRAAVVTVERPGFLPGRFTLRLDTAQAPLTCRSFAQLAEAGFYDGLTIDRVVPGFLFQTGDPSGDGGGEPGFTLRDEISPNLFAAGVVGMVADARDRAGARWFVALTDQPQLDGRVTAFAEVVQNLPGVAALLLPGDRVVSVKLYAGDGSEPLPPLARPAAAGG
ncbi:MAG TPA: HEAT repeat domain-containing protein, partial [Candidatus Polarisedimenticolaceae bacterium]|nr:HEAT repeat domain-containing protein [Candidatus Polarisedimenticolaceae bacterium]